MVRIVSRLVVLFDHLPHSLSQLLDFVGGAVPDHTLLCAGQKKQRPIFPGEEGGGAVNIDDILS